MKYTKKEIEEALENVDENILHLNTKKNKSIKNDILQKLLLKGQELKEYHKKLKLYKFVDEIPDFTFGRHIRWFNLNNKELYLTNGGCICDIQVLEDGINIVVKNYKKRFFNISMNDCIIFQKLTDDEILLMSVLDYIEKN